MLRLDMNLVWTVINLLILFLLMKRFLFKPVNDIFNKRQKQVDAMISDASDRQKSADDMKKKYEDSASQLEKDKEKQLEEARSRATAEYDRIVAEADKKAREALTDAENKAQEERNQIIRDAKEEITEMVIDASSKMTASKAGPETDHALYEKFIEETKIDPQ